MNKSSSPTQKIISLLNLDAVSEALELSETDSVHTSICSIDNPTDVRISNLTPEQAEAFKTFPKFFQDALASNDIEKINEALSRMDKSQSDEVMKKCQETGLITVLSEDEAAEYMEKEQPAATESEN